MQPWYLLQFLIQSNPVQYLRNTTDLIELFQVHLIYLVRLFCQFNSALKSVTALLFDFIIYYQVQLTIELFGVFLFEILEVKACSQLL